MPNEIRAYVDLPAVLDAEVELSNRRRGSMGTTLLRQLLSTFSRRQLAERLGCSYETVKFWVSRGYRPSRHFQKRMMEEFAVPIAAWTSTLPKEHVADRLNGKPFVRPILENGKYEEPRTRKVAEAIAEYLSSDGASPGDDEYSFVLDDEYDIVQEMIDAYDDVIFRENRRTRTIIAYLGRNGLFGDAAQAVLRLVPERLHALRHGV